MHVLGGRVVGRAATMKWSDVDRRARDADKLTTDAARLQRPAGASGAAGEWRLLSQEMIVSA